jgi:hypothetical protein
MSGDHLFYEQKVDRDANQELINKILEKYKSEPPTEALKEKIYNDLHQEKSLGNITIPFGIVLKKDPTGIHAPFIEITLDTRV